MEGNEQTQIEQVNDEVRLQRCLTIVNLQVTEGLTIHEACERANVPERTFYQWVHDGILQEYLVQCRDSRKQVASTMAAEAVPDVIRYMIQLAVGDETSRGTPPHLAAQVVLNAAAGVMGELGEKARPKDNRPVLQFFPQTMTMAIGEQGPRPATQEEILEGECQVIESDEDGA